MNISIPDELYQDLTREAGNVPIKDYVLHLIRQARELRPQQVVIADVEAFLQEVRSWEPMLGKAMVHGGANHNVEQLPNGRVQAIVGGSLLAVGHWLKVRVETGELSERFRDGHTFNQPLLAWALSRFTPGSVPPGEPPLGADDRATIEATIAVRARLENALARVGVRYSDRLIRRQDDTPGNKAGPPV
jgi:hypothetical protein